MSCLCLPLDMRVLVWLLTRTCFHRLDWMTWNILFLGTSSFVFPTLAQLVTVLYYTGTSSILQAPWFCYYSWDMLLVSSFMLWRCKFHCPAFQHTLPKWSMVESRMKRYCYQRCWRKLTIPARSLENGGCLTFHVHVCIQVMFGSN